MGFGEHHDSMGLADVQLQRAMINLQRGNYGEAAAQATRLLECESESPKLPRKAKSRTAPKGRSNGHPQ